MKVQINMPSSYLDWGNVDFSAPYTAFKDNKIYSWTGGNGINASNKNKLYILDIDSPKKIKTVNNFNPFSSLGEVKGDVSNSGGLMATTTNIEDKSLYFIGQINSTNNWAFIKYDIETNATIVLNSNLASKIGASNYANIVCPFQVRLGTDYQSNSANGFFPKTSSDNSIFFPVHEYNGALKILEVDCVTGNVNNFYTIRSNVGTARPLFNGLSLHYSSRHDEIFYCAHLGANANVVINDTNYNYMARGVFAVKNRLWDSNIMNNFSINVLRTNKISFYQGNAVNQNSYYGVTNYQILDLDTLEFYYMPLAEYEENYSNSMYGTRAYCYDGANKIYYQIERESTSGTNFYLTSEDKITNYNSFGDKKLVVEETVESNIINSIQSGVYMARINAPTNRINYGVGEYTYVPLFSIPISTVKPNLCEVDLSTLAYNAGPNTVYNITPMVHKLTKNDLQVVIHGANSNSYIPVNYEIIEYKESK